MDIFAQHLLAEYRECNRLALNTAASLEQLMRAAAQRAGVSILDANFHRFAPQGVSGVLFLEEAHFSIHTWPEAGYAAVDLYSCAPCSIHLAHQTMRDGLGALYSEILIVTRGLEGTSSQQFVSQHIVEPPQHLSSSATTSSRFLDKP